MFCSSANIFFPFSSLLSRLSSVFSTSVIQQICIIIQNNVQVQTLISTGDLGMHLVLCHNFSAFFLLLRFVWHHNYQMIHGDWVVIGSVWPELPKFQVDAAYYSPEKDLLFIFRGEYCFALHPCLLVFISFFLLRRTNIQNVVLTYFV